MADEVGSSHPPTFCHSSAKKLLMKNQSINLFSRTGIIILSSIVAPILVIMVMGLYFPKTWDAWVWSLGLARVDNSSKTSVPTPVSKEIEPPTGEACERSYVSVKLDTFSQCLVEGLSYVQVANTLGYAGTLVASSGSAETWQWNDGGGKYLSITFVNGKLISKSQIGLN